MRETIDVFRNNKQSLSVLDVHVDAGGSNSIYSFFEEGKHFKNLKTFAKYFGSTQYSREDFRQRQQAGFLMLLFSDQINFTLLLTAFYASFLSTQDILQTLFRLEGDTSSASWVQLFEQMSRGEYIKTFAKLSNNIALLLTDSCQNPLT